MRKVTRTLFRDDDEDDDMVNSSCVTLFSMLLKAATPLTPPSFILY